MLRNMKLGLSVLLLLVGWLMFTRGVQAQSERQIVLTLHASCSIEGPNDTVVTMGYTLDTDRFEIVVNSWFEGGNETQFVGYLPSGERTLFAGDVPNYFFIMLPTHPGDWANFLWKDEVTWYVTYKDREFVEHTVSATARIDPCTADLPTATATMEQGLAVATPVADCPRQAYDSGKGTWYCYQPTTNGVVPVPKP